MRLRVQVYKKMYLPDTKTVETGKVRVSSCLLLHAPAATVAAAGPGSRRQSTSTHA